jgi:hypothetical protein
MQGRSKFRSQPRNTDLSSKYQAIILKLTWLCCQFFYFSFLFGELPGKACLVATIMQLVNVMKRWPVEETFLFQHFKRGLYNWPINITYTDMRFLLYLQNNI